MGSCSSTKKPLKIKHKSHHKNTSASATPIKSTDLKELKLNMKMVEMNEKNHQDEPNEKKENEQFSPPPKIFCNGNLRVSQRESIFEKEKIMTPRQRSGSQLKV